MISDLTIAFALSLLGAPYRWGGQDPNQGFDCSGFVITVLQAEGRLKDGFDASSQGLYTYFKTNGALETNYPTKGCLAFFGKSKTEIKHVALCLNSKQLIEAAGGGRNTRTLSEAIRDQAFVRIRPIGYRKDIVAFLTSDIDQSRVIPLWTKKKSE